MTETKFDKAMSGTSHGVGLDSENASGLNEVMVEDVMRSAKGQYEGEGRRSSQPVVIIPASEEPQ